jgi:hypothetical protein
MILESPEKYKKLSLVIGSASSHVVHESKKASARYIYLMLPRSHITLAHVISRTPSEEFSRL